MNSWRACRRTTRDCLAYRLEAAPAPERITVTVSAQDTSGNAAVRTWAVAPGEEAAPLGPDPQELLEEEEETVEEPVSETVLPEGTTPTQAAEPESANPPAATTQPAAKADAPESATGAPAPDEPPREPPPPTESAELPPDERWRGPVVCSVLALTAGLFFLGRWLRGRSR